MALPMRHVHKANSRDRALSPEEVGRVLNAVYESNIRRQFKLALHLTLLTMVRKSELLLAKWDEVNLDAAEWIIPADRTKTSKAHLVFLSTQAVALFKQLKALAGESVYVLPGRGTISKPFAHNSLNNALKVSLQGTDVPAFVIHDFRRTASTILHEEEWAPDVVERALNHTLGGVRGVYNKADYAPQRKQMLQAWADRVDEFRSGKQVASAGQPPVASTV
jgi:integrase